MRSGLKRVILSLAALLTPAVALAAEGEAVPRVELWMATPFVLLLLAIALMPFIAKHWWEKFYPLVALGLGLVTVVYYIGVLHCGERIVHTLLEYISFIALIGSLFVVAGGILIRMRGRSTPTTNVFLLAIGAVISNIVGTTGASMILIRPFLRVNKYRIKPYHVVFFIFIVSNMGGALTPIGDPPLFLGYLRGIPFFWVAEELWSAWLLAIVIVLGVFYGIDRLSYRRLPASVRHEVERKEEEESATGVHNVFFLALILVAVFVTHPPFLREALMVVAAVGSYLSTPREIYRRNEFNFVPVKEVAILFAGIFATMVPALDWLQANANTIGLNTPGAYYWATGSLSSFLDNAPTYLNFLTAAIGSFRNDEVVLQVQHLVQTHGSDIATIAGAHAEEVRNTFAALLKYHGDMVAAGYVPLDVVNTAYLIGNHSIYIEAVSIGAVFFGACTYIGNGPNFMVKSIAEHVGVRTPSFFGYIVRYTLPVLIPIFAIVWFVFFRSHI